MTIDQKLNSFFCQYGDKIWGLWISPFCLFQVSTVVLESTTFSVSPPRRKRHLCWLQRQLENSSTSWNPWKPRHCTERNNHRSKNDWQIQSSVNNGVYKQRRSNLNLRKAGGAPWRPILNLATVLELWRGKHKLFSCPGVNTTISVTSSPILFSILLQLHSQGFWACVPRQGDANSYLGLEGGRKSWLLNTTAHTNPHVGVPPHCDHGTTAAFQGFSMFFVCFDHYQQYYL